MITKRIIPCLDVRDGRVVKGVNFKGLSDVSDPVELARYYSESGADELVFYDITASAEGRKLFTDILCRVAETIFIPLTVGGGFNLVESSTAALASVGSGVSVTAGGDFVVNGDDQLDLTLIAADMGERPVPGVRQGRPGGYRHRGHRLAAPGRGAGRGRGGGEFHRHRRREAGL